MIFEEKRDSKKILQCVKTIYQGASFNFDVAYRKPLFYHNVHPYNISHNTMFSEYNFDYISLNMNLE